MLRTAKVLALLRVSEPVIGEACEQDWYAPLIRIDRRKCLLVDDHERFCAPCNAAKTVRGPPEPHNGSGSRPRVAGWPEDRFESRDWRLDNSGLDYGSDPWVAT